MTVDGTAPAGNRTLSHFMKAPVVAALLREQHGDVKAQAIALREQRKARQARSRRRFAFWTEVAMQIENSTYDTDTQ